MKSILMSIKPKWVEKIASGEKTVEVRKTAPKLAVPFKVYMYCSFPRKPFYTLWLHRGTDKRFLADGKVVGEFVCDNVFTFENSWFDKGFIRALHEGHIYPEELALYLGKKDGYGLHISDLKIYDKPKELSEFRVKKKIDFGCGVKTVPLFRPPQSWCYVEEI